MMEPDKRRFPRWATRVLGALSLMATAVTLWSCVDMVRSGWGMNEVILFLPHIIAFSAFGIYCLSCKKGLPFSWGALFNICKEAREQPEGLDEAVPPKERLEHLKIMLEQEVITREEYEEKRKEILKGL